MTDTTLPAYAAVLESVTRSTPPGGDPSEHLRVTAWILNEMTDTFLMLAFANACDDCEEAARPHPAYPPAGGNYADHPEPTPEVLTEAQASAVKLYAAILAAPGGYDPAPAVRRWVGGNEVHEVSRYWRVKGGGYTEAAARCWGHYAVMSAIGHGVSWEDDNEPLTGPAYRRNIPEGRACAVCCYTIRHADSCERQARLNQPDIGEEVFADDLPSVRELRVSAEDITWSDAPTDAARAVLDARAARVDAYWTTQEYHARVSDIDAARADEDRDDAARERARRERKP